MSYRKKGYRRKRKRYSKWYSPRYMAGYASTAYTALKIAKEVKKMVNTEYKENSESILNAVTVTTTAQIDCLNVLNVGDTHGSRDGNQIKLTSANLRIKAKHNSSGSAEQLIRFIIFIYKNPRLTDPGATDIIPSNSMTYHLDHDLRKRYVILKDWVVKLSLNGTQSYFKKWYKKFNMKVNYDDANSTPETNGLYLMCFSEEATNGPTVTVRSRIRFIDN